jgi:hypothetical protein
MAVSARLWFHFGTTIGRFPAALNLFLLTAIEEQGSRGQPRIENYTKQTLFDVLLEATALQFRPLDASQTRSSGQLMLLIDGPRTKKSGPTQHFRHGFRPTHSPKCGHQMVLVTHGYCSPCSM